MPIIGDQYQTGDGLSLGVSLVLIEIPNDSWIKQNLIAALDTLTNEANFNELTGSNTPEFVARVWSYILQTLQFDYEPPDMTPIGTLIMWGAGTPPTGWLVCDGSEVSRATYASLFSLWGTTFGAGDGTTTFNLMNFIDRSPMGIGGTLFEGDTAGNMEQTLTTNQMPAHTHTINDPGHNHTIPGTLFSGSGGRTSATGGTFNVLANTSTNNNTTGITNNNAGAGLPHSILHPVIGVNVLVFAG